MATLTDVTTRPSSGLTHIDALLDRGPGWNWLSPSRTVLFYTFDTGAVDPNRASEITGGVTPFNAAQQSAVVSALALMSAITGITFSLTAQASQADLHFAAANLTTPSNAGLASWSNSYSFSGQNIVSYTADAWVYLDNVEFSGVNTTPSVGTVGFEVLLHELGHAMGLKHPFEGPVVMPTALDRTSFTLMSYTDSGGPYSSYRSLDIAALRFLYGDDGLGGPLGQGGTARFLTGSPNNDTLTGTAGDDKFEGGAGDDTIQGGAGTDTALFSGNRAGYVVTVTGGEVTVTGPDGNDRLTGVEMLRFADESVLVSPGALVPAGGTVTITGEPRQGSTLTAVPAVTDANGVGTLSLQWQVGRGSGPNLTWTDIAGANSTTFVPVEAQVGQVLRVVARFTDGLGTAETVFGTASEPVANVNDSPRGTVAVTGAAEQGARLTATATLTDEDGLGTVRLAWQASSDGTEWVDLSTTGSTLALDDALLGQLIRAVARYTDGRGTAEAVPSGATARVLGVREGGAGDDVLQGSAVADRIEGRAGRDTLIGSGGNDQLLGGDGLDTAVYAGPRSRFDVGTRAATVTDRTGTEGSDTLQGVERLRFTDGSLAFDLDGAAGTVARLLGAVFGREAVGNATFAGIGLRLADQGLSSAALAALALQARWGDNVPADTVIHGLYRNLLGIDAPASDLAYWRGTLERGEQTPASLAVLAAGLPLTAELIGLPALTDNGLAYIPPA